MCPLQPGHASFHDRHVKLVWNMPGIGSEKDIGVGTVQDHVFIGFAFSAVTGMKISGDVVGVLHTNIVRGKRVEPFSQALRGDLGRSFEVANLVKGMDPGIGSSRCDQGAEPAGQAMDCSFQDALKGGLFPLALPAEIAAPVILQDQPDILIRHCCTFKKNLPLPVPAYDGFSV